MVVVLVLVLVSVLFLSGCGDGGLAVTDRCREHELSTMSWRFHYFGHTNNISNKDQTRIGEYTVFRSSRGF